MILCYSDIRNVPHWQNDKWLYGPWIWGHPKGIAVGPSEILSTDTEVLTCHFLLCFFSNTGMHQILVSQILLPCGFWWGEYDLTFVLSLFKASFKTSNTHSKWTWGSAPELKRFMNIQFSIQLVNNFRICSPSADYWEKLSGVFRIADYWEKNS